MSNNTIDSVIRESVAAKKHSLFQLRRSYPALLVLVFGIAISIFTSNYVQNQVDADRRNSYEKSATSVMSRLNEGVKEHAQILTSVDGLYKSSVQVVRDMFELYGSIPVRSNTALLSVCYVPYVQHENLADFIYYAKSEGYYTFEIQPPGARPIYFPVEYIVPWQRNAHRSGFDLGTQPEALSAIEQARKNSSLSSTEFYNIRPDTLGFFMTTPLHKVQEDELAAKFQGNVIEGVAVLEIDAKKFFERCLGNTTPADSNIVFSVVDMNKNNKETVVYSSGNHSLLESGYTPLISETKEFVIADRTLKATISTVPNFGGTLQGYLPLLTLLGGILTSIIAAAFILSILTSRARAEDLAEKITRSQRRIVEASQDIIAVLNLQGIWQSASPAVEKVLGFSMQELTGKEIFSLIPDDKDIADLKREISESPDEVGTKFDIQMTTKVGDVIWMNWSFTVSKTDGLVYAVGRDVTLEKMAEEQIRLKNRQVQLAEQSALEANEFKSEFMRDLSHQLRNNLTGTMGFMQLLSEELYENDEEMRGYVTDAERSAEQIFTVVTDIVDIADDTAGELDSQKGSVASEKILNAMESIAAKSKSSGKNITVVRGKDSSPAVFHVDRQLIVDCIDEIMQAVSSGADSTEIIVNIRPNTYEKTVEVEMETSPNILVANMIKTYKIHQNKLLEVLPKDKEEILFHLGMARSLCRRNKGSMLVESLGDGEANIVQMSFPMSKTQK